MLEESIKDLIDSNRFLQIDLNNSFLLMLEQSIKVSLTTVTVEQLIYLMVARC
jgi:hypothetical protein